MSTSPASSPLRPNPPIAQVMGELRKAGYAVFLDEDVRLMRNSEAHCSYEINAEREEVTFVDRIAEGCARVLGPRSEEQLRDSCQRFLMLCMSLFLALSGFLADEAMEQIAKTHPAWLGDEDSTGSAPQVKISKQYEST